MDRKIRNSPNTSRDKENSQDEEKNLRRTAGHMDGNQSKDANRETEEVVSIHDLEEVVVRIFDLSDEIQRCVDDPDYAFEQGNKLMEKKHLRKND